MPLSIKRAGDFRGRRGFWFIDNVASLMRLIRGRSDAEDLEKIARFIYIALFALEAILSFGSTYRRSRIGLIPFRGGAKDPWHTARGFCRFQSELPLQLLDFPFLALVKVIQFCSALGTSALGEYPMNTCQTV